MTDISSHLTAAQQYLRKVDEAIACPTTSEKNHKEAWRNLVLARSQMDKALSWLDNNPPK